MFTTVLRYNWNKRNYQITTIFKGIINSENSMQCDSYKFQLAYKSSSKEISIAILTTVLNFSTARLLIGLHVGMLGVDTPIVYKSSCQ